jgi:hypothetical protein
LPIIVREPIWIGTNLIDDALGFYAEGTQVTWTSFGGYWSARFGITGRQSQIERWLEEGLGRDITIFSPSLVTVFEGVVNSVNASIGGLTLSRGPFLDIANKVKLAYSTVDTTVTPPAVGVRTSTDWAEDADSQTLYGVRERVISVGGISVSNADLVRDTALNELKDPETDEQVNLTSSVVPSVIVEVLGYGRLLETYVYNDTTTGTANISTKIQNVLAADPNSTFSTDYTEIETNATQVGQYEQDDRTAMNIIKGLVALGNAASERTLFGIYADRKARYETVPSAVKYQRSVRRSEQALEIYGTGQRVLPWNVESGEWIFFTDLLSAQSPETERRLDLRFTLIEEATYTAPWGLSLKGGKVNRLDQLMARLGLAGSPAL